MCHTVVELYRCGRHTGRSIAYCRNATRDRATGRRRMCSQRSMTRSNQRDACCNMRDCRHRQLGGVWTCCMCGHGPNRYGRCVFERFVQEGYVINPCNHRPCDECSAYRRRR